MSDHPFVKARALCALRHPFWSALMFSTPIEAVPGCGTAFTDGFRIGYDPEFTAKLTVDELTFLLVHELLHIILEHPIRGVGKDPRVANIAMDYVVNEYAEKAGFKPINGALRDPKFDNWTFEKIYAHLLQNAASSGRSGSTSKPRPAGQDRFGSDVRPITDPDRQVAASTQMRQRLAQASLTGRLAGSGGDVMQRLVQTILHPVRPWHEILREYLQATAEPVDTWTRPNKRFDAIYLPARVRDVTCDITMIVDTSGSISREDLNKVAAEVEAISAQTRPRRIRVVYCSDRVVGEDVFDADDAIKLRPVGGGGTDMRVALDYVSSWEQSVVILATDGYTPWPSSEPEFPVVVCCSTDADVPIGSVVRMTT